MDAGLRQRLYYEACIPAGLLVLGGCHYGLPPYGVDSAALTTAVSGLLMAAVVIVQLGMRLGFCSPVVFPGTQAKMFRPQADDGSIWGGVLVPLVVLALNIRDRAAEDTTQSLGLGAYRAWVASIAMSWAFTLLVLGTQVRRARSLPLWLLGCAGVAGLGITGAAQTDTGVCAGVLLAFVAAGMQYAVTRAVVCGLPRSFTLGEAAAIAQGVVLAGGDLAFRALGPAGGYAGAAPQMLTLVLEAAGLGLLLLVYALCRVFPRDGQTVAADAVWLCGLCGAAAVATLGLTALVSGRNPVAWAFAVVFGTAGSVAMLGYWLVLLLIAALFYAHFADAHFADTHTANACKTHTSNAQAKLALHIKRKAYHILAVLLFAPGFVAAPRVLHVGFAAALCVFVCAECVRVLDVCSLGAWMGGFMRQFTDARDAGHVVTAHFYLLGGCAVPVWLGGSAGAAPLAGVLSLGVADTAASLVGVRFGATRWPGSPKTVEGTAAFVVSLFIVCEIVCLAVPRGAGVLGNLAMSAVLGLLEALTEQNDNLIIPLTMYAAATMLAGASGALVHWGSVLLIAAMLAFSPLHFFLTKQSCIMKQGVC
ncbi:dolichol kinase [Coemansia erecta]|nr:dolichol kinase [Coemansia erecta]